MTGDSLEGYPTLSFSHSVSGTSNTEFHTDPVPGGKTSGGRGTDIFFSTIVPHGFPERHLGSFDGLSVDTPNPQERPVVSTQIPTHHVERDLTIVPTKV